MNRKWLREDDEFLIENYPKEGLEYCLTKLNRTRNSIFGRCKKLNLHLNEDTKNKILKISRKKSTHYNVDYNHFLNIDRVEISYILGFIWADGFIRYEPNKKRKTIYSVGVSINTKDSSDIFNIFKKTGGWKLYNRKVFDKRTKKYYNNSIIQTNNEYIVKFLIDNDYDKKSLVNPDKIISKIPENLKNHFYRGFSDGDGCFYNKNRTCQYVLVGSFEQNWKWVEDKYNNMNVFYSKSYQENKRSKSSKIRVVNINDIIKIGEFIYSNWENIGLNRKYEKFLHMKELKIKPIKFWTDDEKNFLINNYEKFGAKYCSEKLNRSVGSIRTYYCINKSLIV